MERSVRGETRVRHETRDGYRGLRLSDTRFHGGSCLIPKCGFSGYFAAGIAGNQDHPPVRGKRSINQSFRDVRA